MAFRPKNFDFRIILRICTIICLGLTVAALGPSSPPQSEVIFVVDVSQSARLLYNNSNAMLKAYHRQISQLLATQDCSRWSLIYFAAGAEIVIRRQRPRIPEKLPFPNIGATISELDQGIKLALSLRPQPSKMIIISDGRIPRHNITRADHSIAVSEVRVTCIPPLIDKPLKDAAVRAVVAPQHVYKGELLGGYVVASSTFPGTFRITVTLGDASQHTIVRVTRPGKFRAYFRLASSIKTRQNLRAKIESLEFQDRCPQNNIFLHPVWTSGEGSILWIANAPPRFTTWPRMTWRTPRQAAQSRNFKNFAVVIIAAGHQKTLHPIFPYLKNYVLDGGALWVIGHPTTLGPGGYGGTILEEILPVWCIPQNAPQISLLVALDISGSMAAPDNTSMKLRRAKHALLQLPENINKTDRFGLILFNNECRIFPLAGCSTLRSRLATILTGIQAKGATDLALALRNAAQEFEQDTFNHPRHMMIISDGLAQHDNTTIFETVARLRKRKVTISVMVIGQQGRKLLAKIAKHGQGQIYFPGQRELHSFLMRDLTRLRPLIEKRNIAIKKATYLPADLSLSYCDGKIIHRRVLVQSKKNAITLLNAGATPLLAIGHYGYGRSAVLATQLDPQWAPGLYRENNCRIAADMLAWLMQSHSTLKIRTLICGNRLALNVIINPDNGDNTLAVQGDWKKEAAILQKIAPGQYSGFLDLPTAGIHKIILRSNNATHPIYRIAYCSVPYPPEIAELGSAPLSLQHGHKTKTRPENMDNLLPVMALLMFIIDRLWDLLRKGKNYVPLRTPKTKKET